MTPDQAPEDPTATPTPETTPEPTPEPAPEEAPVEEAAPAEPAAEEPAPAAEPAAETGPIVAEAAAEQPLFANSNKPAGEKKSHTGLIIGIIAAIVIIAVVLVVVFAIILPNANKGKDGDKKDDNTSQNGGNENGGGNGGSENGGGNGGSNTSSDSVVGKYEIYSVTGTDGKEDTSSVSMIKALGGKYTVEFKSNGTGEIVLDYSESPLANLGDDEEDDDDDDDDDDDGEGISSGGNTTETIKFDWKSDGTLSSIGDDGDLQKGTWSLSSDKNYVSITVDGQTMKFKRI